MRWQAMLSGIWMGLMGGYHEYDSKIKDMH